MALIRCSEHGHPQGRGQEYVRDVEPDGHPHSGVVCGRPGCVRPGLIWLTETEARAYERGERVFGFNTNVTKVRAR